MTAIGRLARMLALKLTHPGVQLYIRELTLISNAIAARPSCNLLVFGVGNDSTFWMGINKSGRTVFLEDDSYWLGKIKAKVRGIEAYAVKYETKMSEWRSHLGQEAELLLALPPEIRDVKWDVVLVDAPAGYVDFVKLGGVEAPGRMKSIYTAGKIVRDGGAVFVHDCEREIEREFSDRYLGTTNLVAEIRGRAILRQYVVHR